MATHTSSIVCCDNEKEREALGNPTHTVVLVTATGDIYTYDKNGKASKFVKKPDSRV